MKEKIAVKDVDSFMQGLKFGAMAVVFSKIDFNKLQFDFTKLLEEANKKE